MIKVQSEGDHMIVLLESIKCFMRLSHKVI